MTDSDQILFDKIVNGDTIAFTALVNQYKNLVFDICLKMLRNSEIAEEAAQDTFIKIHHSITTFKGDSKLSTWVYSIAYRTCLDQLRKQKREPYRCGLDKITEPQLQQLDNSLDLMEIEERKEKIAACLAKLAPEESFLVTLYYYKELSLDEIAKIVGLTNTNVKVKLFRCRKKLATILVNHIEASTLEAYGK